MDFNKFFNTVWTRDNVYYEMCEDMFLNWQDNVAYACHHNDSDCYDLLFHTYKKIFEIAADIGIPIPICDRILGDISVISEEQRREIWTALSVSASMFVTIKRVNIDVVFEYVDKFGTALYYCNKCGNLSSGKPDGYRFDVVCCRNCDKYLFYECYECGERIEIGEEIETQEEGRKLCTRCFNENSYICECCGERHYYEDMEETVDGGLICRYCQDDYYYCDECHKYFRSDEPFENNGYYCCDECRDELFSRCRSCDEWYDREDVSYGICNHCHENGYDCEYSRAIEFLGDDYVDENEERMLYFGIETEVENIYDRYEASRGIRNAFDVYSYYFEVKSDGSLNDGFEFNTQPSTWGYLKENAWNIRSALSEARNYGSSGPGSNCGLHVHVNRNAFEDDYHIALFNAFFDYNVEELTELSKRNNRSLSEYANFKVIEDGTTPFEHFYEYDRYSNCHKKWFYRSGNLGRYAACNLTNTRTIEVRLFKGTLEYEEWFGIVSFVRSVFYFTKKLYEEKEFDCFPTWKQYIEFVNGLEYDEDYKYLIPMIMEEKELVKI